MFGGCVSFKITHWESYSAASHSIWSTHAIIPATASIQMWHQGNQNSPTAIASRFHRSRLAMKVCHWRRSVTLIVYIRSWIVTPQIQSGTLSPAHHYHNVSRDSRDTSRVATGMTMLNSDFMYLCSDLLVQVQETCLMISATFLPNRAPSFMGPSGYSIRTLLANQNTDFGHNGRGIPVQANVVCVVLHTCL